MAIKRIAVPERHGLICAFELPTATPLPVDVPVCDAEAPTWLHFNLADSRARHWLANDSGLSASMLSVFFDAQPRARAQQLDGAVVCILEDAHYDFQGDPEGFGDFRVLVDHRRVLSARRHPLKTADLMKRSLEGGLTIPSTYGWLAHFAQLLAHNFAELVKTVVDRADAIEDEIVAGEGQAQRAALAHIRRLLVRLRRHLHANRAALATLPFHGRPDEHELLRSARERLDGVAQDLDLVHERVRLLQDELAGLLAEATNRNLYVLSTVTTVLLPTTLITGLWGMNVGGLPWADDPHGFAWALLLVVGSIVICLLLLRGSRVV